MPDKISGGCACRAIRYETEADPIVMVNCHCRDCQRATGAAYGAYVFFPRATVRMQGEPRYYKTKGNAGRAVEHGFCANCGSPVAVKLERMLDAIGVVAASLDDPSHYKPAMEFFTDSAWPWDIMHPDSKKFPQGLP
jgi:hypothetical protein